MKIYNKEKTQILENYDLTKGYLKDDILVIQYPQKDEIKEIGHYEVVKVYPNGRKALNWVVDVKGQKFSPAYTKEENIRVYIPYTEEEIRKIEYQNQINKLKMYLENTDYVANKLAEATAKCSVTNDQSEVRELLVKYDTILTNRKKHREQISILELSL